MMLLDRAGQLLRLLAMLLALIAGAAYVAGLWQEPLAQETLWVAGRGVLLLLLALGLMGTARLSLVLIVLITTPQLLLGLGSEAPAPWAKALETLLLLSASAALITSFTPQTSSN